MRALIRRRSFLTILFLSATALVSTGVAQLPDLKGAARSAGRKAGEKAAKSAADKAADAVIDAVKDEPPPGEIKFIGKNKMATANGTFKKWRLTKVNIDRENPEKSVIEIEVDVASIDTRIERRDNHLRSADFFDVEKYPKAKLKIYEAKFKEKKGSRSIFDAKLDMDMHGVKKTLPLQFDVTKESPMEVTGKITIDRTDFKIGGDYNGVNPASVEVEIPITFRAKLEKS